LETEKAYRAFERVAEDLQRLYGIRPSLVACDDHPDYFSTRYARHSGYPVKSFQHHAAHVAACMAENELEGPVLGVSWDGTGLGSDGTIWGGEFLRMERGKWQRVACLRRFRLPGGSAAVKEPRRSALGLLRELFGEGLWDRAGIPVLGRFEPKELEVLRGMLTKGINAPLTTSAGRLFDAVAAMVLGSSRMNFEGQAAMELEWVAAGFAAAQPYAFELLSSPHSPSAPIEVDWGPMILQILIDAQGVEVAPGLISARFHLTLAEMIAAVARAATERRVVLTGGCFQNRLLTELTVSRLQAAGFQPYWHQRIPPNDAGVALGQAVMLGYAS
jgi:hydrogenase maturation protein HypF